MTLLVQKSAYTTPEFDQWWGAEGRNVAAAGGLEVSVARALSWDASAGWS